MRALTIDKRDVLPNAVNNCNDTEGKMAYSCTVSNAWMGISMAFLVDGASTPTIVKFLSCAHPGISDRQRD